MAQVVHSTKPPRVWSSAGGAVNLELISLRERTPPVEIGNKLRCQTARNIGAGNGAWP